ncbi:hypothetical protein BT67DRAFT_314457 [Trichocladium antarcticum]|uniref:Uncharacterized protein n=1 Tax=Trichocladium antarcticum TaxID=1450529 RepID=A0AAN6UJZ2_9PEZI|nr:hypothetical protein BT67DRAFT_314457 [Trichocladium antarcticum]
MDEARDGASSPTAQNPGIGLRPKLHLDRSATPRQVVLRQMKWPDAVALLADLVAEEGIHLSGIAYHSRIRSRPALTPHKRWPITPSGPQVCLAPKPRRAELHNDRNIAALVKRRILSALVPTERTLPILNSAANKRQKGWVALLKGHSYPFHVRHEHSGQCRLACLGRLH